jgi:hypothetical protein
LEPAGFHCLPRPEPTGRKRKVKSSDAVAAPAAKKTSRKRGRPKKLTRTETRTSAQELVLLKALGCSKKFSIKSSGLSVVEKAIYQKFYLFYCYFVIRNFMLKFYTHIKYDEKNMYDFSIFYKLY